MADRREEEPLLGLWSSIVLTSRYGCGGGIRLARSRRYGVSGSSPVPAPCSSASRVGSALPHDDNSCSRTALVTSIDSPHEYLEP